MLSFRRFVVLLSSLTMSIFVFVRVGHASLLSPNTELLEVTISSARGEVLLGESILWQITITRQDSTTPDVVELRPGDPSVWHWPSGAVTTTLAVSTTTVLNVVAVPLELGSLTPTVEMRYATQEGSQVQLAIASAALKVTSPDALVIPTILPRQVTATEGGQWLAILLLENASPFVLETLHLNGVGTDLEWNSLTGVSQVAPHQTMVVPITATVTGQHAQPQLVLEYTWIDEAQRSRSRSVSVIGPELSLREERLGWLYTNVGSAIIGFVVGFAGSFLQMIVNARREQSRQREINREHVLSLLDLTVLQTKQAMLTTTRVDLEPLQRLYLGESGLYTVVHEEKLAELVADLYRTASDYNSGLERPGGSQRLFELQRAQDALANALRALSLRHIKSNFLTETDGPWPDSAP